MTADREAFETWAKPREYNLRKTPNFQVYFSSVTEAAWQAWKARVPEGYVVVPREPTTRMCIALSEGLPGDKSVWACYRAMIAASAGE